MIEMKTVSSSMIDAVGYDPAHHSLRVKFNNGATWQYDGVPPDVSASLESAGSIGKAFNSLVKDKFSAHRVE
jgi:hypothetical protein